MAESTLSLTYNGVASWIGRVMNFGSTVGSFTADQATEVAQTIDRGYRQFLYPPPVKLNESDVEYVHSWTFLRPTATLTTSEPYSTGTVSISSGVVTLASGTFPSWAASGELVISGVGYTVSTRDGDNQVTLDDTTVDADAGTVFVLVQTIYAAPDEFGGLDSRFTYAPNTEGAVDIQETSEDRIRELRSYSDWDADKPRKVAQRVVNATSTSGQRHEFIFWPPPDDAYILTYRYVALPDAVATTQYFLGGMAHSETILASCLVMAQRYLRNEDGVQRAMADFMVHLRASIMLDRANSTPDHLPENRNPGDEQWDRNYPTNLRPQRMTYNGVLTT